LETTMTAVPARLATRHLQGPDAAKAAQEAQANMLWLLLAGEFEAAWTIAQALLTPGPWALSKQSPLHYETWRVLFWLGDRLGRPRPPIDPQNQLVLMALQSIRTEAKGSAGGGLMALLGALGGGGGGGRDRSWPAAELAAILASVRPGSYGRVFNEFQQQATPALQARASSGTAEASRDHGAIADTIEAAARTAFPKDLAEMVMPSAWAAASIDLQAGRREAAVERLARLLPHAPIGNLSARARLELDRAFEPAIAALLASHALAPALGITREGAASYVLAFASRGSQASGAAAPAESSAPWGPVLKDFEARLAEEGVDTDELLAALASASPDSPALAQRAALGQLRAAPCPAAELAALEARLGTGLPPSYREFLLAANGLVVPDTVSLLPAAQVAWLKDVDPETIAAWSDTHDDEASDEQYATYGPDQDCVHMRTRHLRTALRISTTLDGDVFLLIPEVRFGAEWEAWFLGSKNPGAYRYRSFRELMLEYVLQPADG